jgi:protoheme IX farnesyltransferase
LKKESFDRQGLSDGGPDISSGSGWGRIKDYLLLIKPSLTIMVVFSSVISLMLTQGWESYVNKWKMVFLLFAGGMLVTGSANAINQVVEKDTDSRMKRTANRPIASGRVSVSEGWVFAIITGAIGVFMLGYYFNWLTAGLAGFSLFLYAFIYTPLKKVNSIAVLAGAVPGALPCLIGWTAGENNLAIGGWVLFAFQFFWQFPHFWAIAWVAHRDYSAVGFKLLPANEGPTKFTALQAIAYSLLLIPITTAPYFIGMCSYNDIKGVISIVLVSLANVFMVGRCVTLYRKMDAGSARKVMFGSYMYLPVVMLAWLLSKV